MLRKCTFLRGQTLQILSSAIVCLGVFSFSLGHLWPSPALPKLLSPDPDSKTIQITIDEGSWVATLQLIAIPFSSFITLYLANYFGTKYILHSAAIPLFLSWILVNYGNHVYYIYIGRCLVGLSDTFFFNCAPLYIAEISNPEIRGRLVSSLQLLFNLGGCFIFFFGYKLSIETFAICATIPAVLYFILFTCMPQSPYYYIAKRKYSLARQSLEILEDRVLKNEEFETYKSQVESEVSNEGSLFDLFKNKVSFKCLKMVITLIFFQTCIGAVTMTTYTHHIIAETNINVEWTALVFAMTTTISSLGAAYLVDKKGRRPLLLSSLFGSGIFITILGAIFCAKERNIWTPDPYFKWSSIIALILYIFWLNMGILNVPLLLCGELFPVNLKNYGICLMTASYGVGGVLTNKIFHLFMENFGMYYVFFGFGLIAFCGVIYVYYCLPETRNKSLFEIQIMLNSDLKSEKNKFGSVI